MLRVTTMLATSADGFQAERHAAVERVGGQVGKLRRRRVILQRERRRGTRVPSVVVALAGDLCRGRVRLVVADSVAGGDAGGGVGPGERDGHGVVVEAAGVRRPVGCRAGHGRRRRVVLQGDARARAVARLVAATSRDCGRARVGAGVGRRSAAAVDAGHGVGSGEGNPDRMVVPAVCVRAARRGRRDARRRRVVLERERLRSRDKTRAARTRSRDRCGARVRAGVAGRRARGDPGHRSGAGRRDLHRMVVPAVRVRVRAGRSARSPSAALRRV